MDSQPTSTQPLRKSTRAAEKKENETTQNSQKTENPTRQTITTTTNRLPKNPQVKQKLKALQQKIPETVAQTIHSDSLPTNEAQKISEDMLPSIRTIFAPHVEAHSLPRTTQLSLSHGVYYHQVLLHLEWQTALGLPRDHITLLPPSSQPIAAVIELSSEEIEQLTAHHQNNLHSMQTTQPTEKKANETTQNPQKTGNPARQTITKTTNGLPNNPQIKPQLKAFKLDIPKPKLIAKPTHSGSLPTSGALTQDSLLPSPRPHHELPEIRLPPQQTIFPHNGLNYTPHIEAYPLPETTHSTQTTQPAQSKQSAQPTPSRKRTIRGSQDSTQSKRSRTNETESETLKETITNDQASLKEIDPKHDELKKSRDHKTNFVHKLRESHECFFELHPLRRSK